MRPRERLGPRSRSIMPILLILLSAALALPLPLRAQTCTVPGSHVTIQAAVDDPACATVNLSAQSYAESAEIPRSLTLAGPGGGGAVVGGLVRAAGAGTLVTLRDLRIENGCENGAFEAIDGAEVTGDNLEVEHSAAFSCPPWTLFQDGFETGDISAWSASVPGE